MRIRSYTHPMLSSLTTDYVDGSKFDVSVEVNIQQSDNSEEFALSYVCALENKALRDAIVDGSAILELEIYSRHTIWRKSFLTATLAGEILLPAAQLFGNVEISAYLVSTRENHEFVFEGINGEYEGSKFVLGSGELLAEAPPVTVPINFGYRANSEFVHVTWSADFDTNAYEISVEQNKIEVVMGKNSYQSFNRLLNSPETKAQLHVSIYKDCIAAAVLALAHENTSETTYLWGDAFRNALTSKGIELSPDLAFEEANRIAMILKGREGYGSLSKQSE